MLTSGATILTVLGLTTISTVAEAGLCVSYGIFYFISNFASDGIDSTHGAILACECEIDLRSNKKLI